jgi:hypothetical protein
MNLLGVEHTSGGRNQTFKKLNAKERSSKFPCHSFLWQMVFNGLKRSIKYYFTTFTFTSPTSPEGTNGESLR